MKTSERILHMVLFEGIALVLLAGLAMLVTSGDMMSISGLAVGLSLIAMLWNYAFNFLFDKAFGQERMARGLKVRMVHGLLFELGMLILTLPLIMWVLNWGLWQALVADIGVMVFFLLYAMGFNYAYDVIRFKYQGVKSA